MPCVVEVSRIDIVLLGCAHTVLLLFAVAILPYTSGAQLHGQGSQRSPLIVRHILRASECTRWGSCRRGKPLDQPIPTYPVSTSHPRLMPILPDPIPLQSCFDSHPTTPPNRPTLSPPRSPSSPLSFLPALLRFPSPPSPLSFLPLPLSPSTLPLLSPLAHLPPLALLSPRALLSPLPLLSSLPLRSPLPPRSPC